MQEKEKTIYLIDGSSYIYRAYHAIRHLSNSKGFPTNAVFGFSKMLLKLITDISPEYILVAFDAKGPTFRHKMYEDYKANRPPMPDDLVVQLPHIHEVVRNLNLPMIEKAGYEADDVLGTLARMGEDKGFKVVIVTGDKDFRQLVSERISLWDTMKDKVTAYNDFIIEYGLEPSQMIEVMGLSGDNADNIPGVRGVGEKTALGLIKEYGTMDGLYDHIEAITRKKLKENLLAARDNAYLSRKLVTIDTSVPLEENIDDLRIKNPDNEALARLFRELEFKGLWDQFALRSEPTEKEYKNIFNENELLSVVGKIRELGEVSIDTETTSKDPLLAELVGISLSFEENSAYYLPLAHHYLGVPEQMDLDRALIVLKDMIEDERVAKIGQNIKYDVLVLKKYGIEIKGIRFDTMVASYVINPGLRQHNLDYLAQHYLGHKMISYKDVVGKGKQQLNFSEVDVTRAMEYSCEDAEITFRLKRILEEKLKEDCNEELFYGMEMKLLPVLTLMEWSGVKIDTDFFREMSEEFARQLKKMEDQIYSEAGETFNINSPQQLGYILFEKLKLPVQKKTNKTGAYSTDMKVLKALCSTPFQIPKLLLRYRTLSKLKSTYLDALVKMVNFSTKRIHTSYNQTVTATGRLSSSNPNLQNIPIRGEEGREIRKGFIPEQGNRLLAADYSQVELRIFAHYSNDPVFIDAFKRDEDIHSITASEIMDVHPSFVTEDMRRVAKAINFGIIYGMGPQKLSQELGIDLKSAKDYIDTYYKKYEGVKRFKEETIAAGLEKGYVTTLFNRRRYLPDLHHKNRIIRGEAERMAINTPIQGTAADLIKRSMISIQTFLLNEDLKTRMILQVHDELVFEVPDNEINIVKQMVVREMEGVFKLKVPLKVDINEGANWDEAH